MKRRYDPINEIMQSVNDGQKWFYVFRVGDKSHAEYDFGTREACEEAMILAKAKAGREYVFETVRRAADQTEIVFPTLSRRLKEAYKVMTKRYPKPLIADLLEKKYPVSA